MFWEGGGWREEIILEGSLTPNVLQIPRAPLDLYLPPSLYILWGKEAIVLLLLFN